MLELEQSLAKRISQGIQKKYVSTPGEWAARYRRIGKPPQPWSFRLFPWTKEIHDCTAEMLVIQKGAQMGITEAALNMAFAAIDLKGMNVMYILPNTTPDAKDFSTSRFDAALEQSEYIRDLFSDVKNIGHKRAGAANLFIRGSKSEAQLKSVPASRLFLDEVDAMETSNIPLAFERVSGQVDRMIMLLSTPTLANKGINMYYKDSSQKHFLFPCPSCSRRIELKFPESMVITSEDPHDPKIMDTHLICYECKAKIPHEGKPEFFENATWEAGRTDCMTEGYYINQLYSCMLQPYKIAQLYLESQHNPAAEQEFYNSKMGMPHTVEGARVTDKEIDACTQQYAKQGSAPANSMVTMGVDVGKWLHVEINQWFVMHEVADPSSAFDARLLMETKVKNFEELDMLMNQYQVNFCVIDANPERRKALEFAKRFWGRVRLCFYGRGMNGKTINIHSEEEHTITVDRTAWLDLSLGRLRRQAIEFPIDLSVEYKEHLKNLARIYLKDAQGNLVARYDNEGEDHFAHARNYCEIALPMAASMGANQNIGGVY